MKENGDKSNFILFQKEEENLFVFLKWTALKCDLLFVAKDMYFHSCVPHVILYRYP